VQALRLGGLTRADSQFVNHSGRDDPIGLSTIRIATMIFTPRGFLSEPDEIGTGDTVMVAYLAPPHPENETLRVVRVGLNFVAEAMGFLVVDPAQRDAGAEHIPARRLGMEGGPWGDMLAGEAQRSGLVAEHAG
jgi:hypothetical protein